MRRPVLRWLGAALVVAVAWASPGCGNSGDAAARITVFAAVSLTDVLRELGEAFEDGRAEIVFNFAGSNTLRDQIVHGAKADLFLSAHPRHMDTVERAGLVVAGTRVDLLANRLVLVVPYDADVGVRFPPSPGAPAPFARLSIAQPGAVPAGIYATEALSYLGLEYGAAELIVPALDVRAALGYVETRNVDAAIVYATDAALSSRVRVAYEFPPASHAPIRYPAALLTSAADVDRATRFLTFLGSELAHRTYQHYGFVPAD